MEISINEIIRNRRSSRKYIDHIISDRDIEEILYAGILAPSGKNRKPWRFIIVKDKIVIKAISKSVKYSRFVRNVPLLILVYAIERSSYSFEKDLLSIGACLENIQLSATANNYGSCIIGELFDKQDEVNKYINLDTNSIRLICGIAIGKNEHEINNKNNMKYDLNDYLLGII